MKGPVNCFKTHFSLIFSFNFLSITWIIQAQQVVRPLELSRAYILKPKPTRNTYQREWPSFHSRGIHSFRILIGVVPKKCKEPLFCTSDISVVFSVFATCISVQSCVYTIAMQGMIPWAIPLQSVPLTTHLPPLVVHFVPVGLKASEACSRSCPATVFVVMKNRVGLVPSLLAGKPILSCLLLKV